VNDLIQFAGYQLDPDTRSLRRDRNLIALNPKTFDLLLYLVKHPQQLITKDELLTAVWPDSFVEENNLTQHVFLLRKALAATGQDEPMVITVPGKGYQFTAAVEQLPRSGATQAAGELVLHSVQSVTRMVVEEETDDEAPVRAALPAPRPRRARGLWAMSAAIIGALAVVVIAAGYFGYKKFENAQSHSAVSIVVLPFTNLTGDPSKEYLSDGITEEMITRLARSEGGQLRVIARTSAMSYKSTGMVVRQIAQELGVQYVLEGSVQSEGNHLRVTAQLIRGNDQTHVWADTFDGDTGQVLEFESRLTDSVAQSLSLKLLARTTEHTPLNDAAHNAYLQGLYYVSQRSRAGLHNALQSFGTAVAQDPQYARAYAELAVTYNLLGQYSWMDTSQAHSQAKAAALQAIAADPNLAEAHAALGFSKWFYEWNPAAAENELLEAIQLEPTNVDARHWYALVLMTSGRLVDAEKQMRAALALDPKALILRTNLGWIYYTDHQYPLAIQEIEPVVNENPDFLTAHYKLWWIYSVTGDVPRAWKELRAVAHLIFTPDYEDKIVAVYEKEGYAESLKAMTSINDWNYSGSLVDGARCMSFAGDKPAALEFLERALKAREGWMVFLESDPAFDSLRSDPGYSRILREVRSVANSFH
jgi:TolB-like protein/DNA-binding winged helix-turn-helix (wHTH) protein/Flp pilus assembly protein TadD